MMYQQLTWDTYEQPLCIRPNTDWICGHNECNIAHDCNCCSGCKAYSSDNPCRSRCYHSIRNSVADNYTSEIKRLTERGYTFKKHNRGAYVYMGDIMAYLLVENK